MRTLVAPQQPDDVHRLVTVLGPGFQVNESGAPDLILAAASGFPALRAAHPHAVIIALDPAADPTVLDKGADDVLLWPHPAPEQLRERLELHRRWARRAAASRDRANGIASATAEGIAIYDETRVLYVNDVMQRMLGTQMANRPLTQFVTEAQSMLAAVRLGRGDICTELDITRADGTSMPVEVTARDGLWDDRPVRIATVRDLTVQRAREAADARREAEHRAELQAQLRTIEESNARFELVARATNDVLYDWDVATGRIVWNDALRGVLRYAGDGEAAGIQWWASQVHPDDSDRISASLDRAMRDGSDVWSDSYRFSVPDATGSGWLDLIDRGVFMRDASGACTRMIGAMTDVTGRKQLQTRLVLADRLASVGTMAAGVAHELNNPLTWVLANIRLVQESLGPTLPPPSVRALEHAAQGAERMRSIVHDLKVFSRNEQHAVVPVDVRSTLQSAMSIVHSSLSARARLEHVDTTVGSLFVLGNEARLAQVLLNLLVNAVQAIAPGMPERNRVTVTVGRTRENVTIHVADTGCGIPAAVRARIFDPFFTTKPTGEGTGLGLSIGLQLTQEMGGEILLVPRAGRGTTFCVRLPLTEAVPEATARTSIPPIAASAGRVLIVDDEPMIVELVGQILAPEVEVSGEHLPGNALRRLRAGERFDAVLCDVMMPVLNGMELYRAVSQISAGQAARFLFVTGGVANPDVEEFLVETGRPFVEKPFDLHDLRAKVRRAIEAR